MKKILFFIFTFCILWVTNTFAIENVYIDPTWWLISNSTLGTASGANSEDYAPFDDYYYLAPDESTWERFCFHRGGTLVSITSISYSDDVVVYEIGGYWTLDPRDRAYTITCDEVTSPILPTTEEYINYTLHFYTFLMIIIWLSIVYFSYSKTFKMFNWCYNQIMRFLP